MTNVTSNRLKGHNKCTHQNNIYICFYACILKKKVWRSEEVQNSSKPTVMILWGEQVLLIISYLLADEVDPRGGTVAEVGSLRVPVSLRTNAHVWGHTWREKKDSEQCREMYYIKRHNHARKERTAPVTHVFIVCQWVCVCVSERSLGRQA